MCVSKAHITWLGPPSVDIKKLIYATTNYI